MGDDMLQQSVVAATLGQRITVWLLTEGHQFILTAEAMWIKLG